MFTDTLFQRYLFWNVGHTDEGEESDKTRETDPDGRPAGRSIIAHTLTVSKAINFNTSEITSVPSVQATEGIFTDYGSHCRRPLYLGGLGIPAYLCNLGRPTFSFTCKPYANISLGYLDLNYKDIWRYLQSFSVNESCFQAFQPVMLFHRYHSIKSSTFFIFFFTSPHSSIIQFLSSPMPLSSSLLLPSVLKPCNNEGTDKSCVSLRLFFLNVLNIMVQILSNLFTSTTM